MRDETLTLTERSKNFFAKESALCLEDLKRLEGYLRAKRSGKVRRAKERKSERNLSPRRRRPRSASGGLEAPRGIPARIQAISGERTPETKTRRN
eukprot:132950-Prorocentrum_minimum.AAC.2